MQYCFDIFLDENFTISLKAFSAYLCLLLLDSNSEISNAILSALKGAGNTVRAMVHHARSAEQIAAIGVAETIWGDVEDRNDVERACEGIEAIYYIAPNMTPAERSIGQNMIAGAKAQLDTFKAKVG